MRHKPTFSKDDVDCIVGTFQNDMTKEGLSVTPELESKFADYVVSTKHEYENYLLEKVKDGDVSIIFVKGHLNWNVNLFSPTHTGNKAAIEKTQDFIQRSIEILRLQGGPRAGRLK